MREYRVAKGWSVFIYIVAPAMLALFGWVLVMLLTAEELPLWILLSVTPVCLAMIALMLVGLLDTVRGRLLITKDTLSIQSTFINRELKFDKIKGYQVTGNYILIIPNTPHRKRIKCSTYIGKSEELITWLSLNFTDLDLENQAIEEKEILESAEFGRNEEEREEKLKQARSVAKVLNWTGSIVMIWAFLFPRPYEFALLSCLLVPLISIVM